MLELITIDAETIYNNCIQRMEIASGEPLYPGDERRIFAEAVVAVLVGIANKCNAACNSKFLDYAEDSALDALGARTGTTRLPAAAAKAVFEFTLDTTALTETTIPQGTLITTDGDIDFATDEDLIIPAGESSGAITATCTETGTIGNGYIAGSIAQLVNSIPGVLSAVNTETTAGGSDAEEDDTYRERIRIAPSSFSTAGSKKGYIYWAKSASATIQDVYVDVPSPCIINLYVLCKEAQLPNAALLALVEESCRADDRRPVGDLVTAYAPTSVPYNIEITCYTDDPDAVDAAVQEYVWWQAGAIGRAINPDKLRALCLNAGCTRVDVISPTHTPIGTLEVALPETITITKEEP